MKLIASRQLTDAHFGTVLAGQVFSCETSTGVDLVQRGLARRADPPRVRYETKVVWPQHKGTAAGLPSVTCVCVTKDREKFLRQAIGYFQAQTYPNCQLLIVSEGHDDWFTGGAIPRVTQIDIDPGCTVGEKRNFGALRASSELIAHWDDDDYYAPDRISDQVQRLMESRKAVTGYHSMRFTDGTNWWQYRGAPDYALGTSLCYRKQWWADHPFPALNVAEDNAFVKVAAQCGELESVDAELRIVATIHPGNTSPRNLAGDEWTRVPDPGIPSLEFNL